jgi:hypothetical protein
MFTPARTRWSVVMVAMAASPPMECPAMPIRLASIMRAYGQGEWRRVSSSSTKEMSWARLFAMSETPPAGGLSQMAQARVRPSGKVVPEDS